MKAITHTLVGPALALVGLVASAQEAPSKPVAIDIEPQSMVDALNGWAQQTGFQLIIPHTGAIDRLAAPRVKGQFSARAALDYLLADTQLRYEFVNERTVAIHERLPAVTGRQIDPRFLHLAAAQLGGGAAESEGERSAAANTRASGDGKARGLEEVIVTARKRAENVQDVPIAITVVTAEDIDQRGLVSTADYLRGTPGVNQTGDDGTYGGQAIVIRGIETSLRFQNTSAGSTTATYFGETPTTAAAGYGGSSADIKLVDIERVEVLRGPQGTAFGNSSMGGAVRTTPVAPKLGQLEGKVAATYSVTSDAGDDNYNFQGIANIPLMKDKLAVRAVGYQYQDSGYYLNVAGSDPAYQAGWVIPNGLQAFAHDEDDVGAYRVAGGRMAVLLQATDDLRFTLSYLRQKNETDGYPLQSSGLYEQTMVGVAPEHTLHGHAGGGSELTLDIANAVAEYDFGWADLLATYSYIESDSAFSFPYGPQTITNFQIAASQERTPAHRENVGEIRLATKLDGAWDVLAGVYLEEHFDRDPGIIIWHGNLAAQPAYFSPRGVDRQIYSDENRAELKQSAVFAEVSWQPLQQLTFTGGARGYEYERSYVSNSRGALVGGVVPTTSLEGKDSGVTYRTNVTFQPNGDTLFYAGWTQGFRLGKPTQSPPAAVCDVNPSDGIVDGTNISLASAGDLHSDEIDSYEIGAKLTRWDRRLIVDAAVFRMDWSDIPVSIRPPCAFPFSANAGDARAEGIELQANLALTPSLRADIGGSYTDATIVGDVPRAGYFDGDRLPGSPRVNGNLGLQYEFDIGGHATLVRADTIYVDSFYGNVQQAPNTKAGGYVKVDAMARVTFDRLNVDLFVRNLTNEDAFTYKDAVDRGPLFGYRLRPRTIGVQLGYTF